MRSAQGIVYIKANRNTEVIKPEVSIGDIAKIECVNPTVSARIRSMRLLKFPDKRKEGIRHPNRVAVSILKVIACIHEVYPEMEIQNMGEKDFIVTYEQQNSIGRFGHILKAASVVVISFAGAAFSIMTFNNDVDVKNIFAQIFELTTVMKSDGFTVIELFYSIGIVIGILVFFNHFGKKRFTVDPTPIEVEMRLYENDIQTTLIEDYSRKEQELDVGR